MDFTEGAMEMANNRPWVPGQRWTEKEERRIRRGDLITVEDRGDIMHGTAPVGCVCVWDGFRSGWVMPCTQCTVCTYTCMVYCTYVQYLVDTLPTLRYPT